MAVDSRIASASSDRSSAHPAWEYNRVPEMAAQIPSIDHATLRKIGRLFVQRQAYQHFGLTLLHRHQMLEPGHVMVHEKTASQDHICTAAFYDSRSHYTHSYFLGSEGKMIPFEYTTEAPPVPDAMLLHQVSAFLFDHELDRCLGISAILTQTPLKEHLLTKGGTIATPIRNAADLDSMSGVDTMWAFRPDESDVKIRVLKKCSEDPSGGHKVV